MSQILTQAPAGRVSFTAPNEVRRILFVAYSLATVSEESCGGAEQMLFVLERELYARGHQTSVAACNGSRVTGKLIATGTTASDFDQYNMRNEVHHTAVRTAIDSARSLGNPYDLVHDQGGSFWMHAADLDAPVLATLHLPRSFYPEGAFDHVPDNVSFVCVSHSQLASFADVPRVVGVIPNGLPTQLFPFSSQKAEYLVWLGRLCEEKGAHLAMDAAEKAGLPLILMGPSYLYSRDQDYFDRMIASRIRSNPQFTFLGSPKFQTKLEILRNAKALLMPTLLEETSSLVCLEAMACGTPAIALRRGALPEVVCHGSTGFVVDAPEQMAAAVSNLRLISPYACREHVEVNHSATRMANDYERLYSRIVKASTTSQTRSLSAVAGTRV